MNLYVLNVVELRFPFSRESRWNILKIPFNLFHYILESVRSHISFAAVHD